MMYYSSLNEGISNNLNKRKISLSIYASGSQGAVVASRAFPNALGHRLCVGRLRFPLDSTLVMLT